MKIKNNIKEIVSATRISEAIKMLKNLVSDKEYFNQILLLESRYNKAKIDQIKGLIYADSFNIEIRNVSNSLLELIDDLPKEFDLLIKALKSL